MQSTRGAAILAAVAVLTGGLTACGDDSEPQESTTTASPIDRSTDSPSSSGSSSSSGSETSSASGEGKVAELPEEAKARTKEGAIAFNEWYWTQTGEALHTGDASTMLAYSAKCAVCDNVAESVAENAENGIHMDKNPYSTTGATGRARDDSGYRVELTVKIARYSQVLNDGSKGKTADAGQFTTVSNTQWQGGHWVITDLVRVK